MAPKPTNWRMYSKMAIAGVTCCVGGPALIYWVSPTEEELFLKYNPDLQKRSLANRVKTQADFDDFAMRLRESSKSDKPIWDAIADAEKLSRDGKIAEQAKLMEEMKARKEEIRKSGTSLVSGGSL